MPKEVRRAATGLSCPAPLSTRDAEPARYVFGLALVAIIQKRCAIHKCGVGGRQEGVKRKATLPNRAAGSAVQGRIDSCIVAGERIGAMPCALQYCQKGSIRLEVYRASLAMAFFGWCNGERPGYADFAQAKAV
jgi:hypothetical protein